MSTGQSERPNDLTRSDLDETAQVITTRVDEKGDEVRADLSDHTDILVAQAAAAKDANDLKVEMTRQELASLYEVRQAIVDQKFRDYRGWYIAAVVSMLLLNTVLYYLYLHPRSAETKLELSEISVASPTDLCPGEYLDFEFTMNVKESGVYGLDMSVFRVSPPPAIVVFSESQIFVIGSPREFLVKRHWQIPERYEDQETGEIIDLIPGDYERDISVGTTSRDTFPSVRVLDFSIRQDCT